MTKQQIRTDLNQDWMEVLEGMTKEQAIQYLSNFPSGVELDTGWHNYDDKYGIVYAVRYETDEEGATREAEEAAEEIRLEALEKEQAERSAELFDAKLERLRGGDKALFNYLTTHKGNPQVGDLENLWLSLKGLQDCAGSKTAQESLTECMMRIEKNTPRKRPK